MKISFPLFRSIAFVTIIRALLASSASHAATPTDDRNAILMDIGLPGMDGYEAGKAIRRELGNDVFLVALIGYGQEGDQRRSFEAGFNEHVTKPVDLPALQTLLSSRIPADV